MFYQNNRLTSAAMLWYNISIAEHNTITLDEYGSFGEMLNVAVNFERYLKTVYPNGYFQSYFILKKNEKPFLIISSSQS